MKQQEILNAIHTLNGVIGTDGITDKVKQEAIEKISELIKKL